MPLSARPDPAPPRAGDTRIRVATDRDAHACLSVYAPYVRESVITLEEEVPDPREFARRIARARDTHSWLVAEDPGDPGGVLGYACAGPLRDRTAYRWSCEVSIYLAPYAHGCGLGRRLYRELFTRLEDQGYRRLVAVVTLPNPASLGLHRSLGFRDGPVLERIGYKHGRWVDVAWLQADLGAGAPLAPPRRDPGHHSS